MCRFHIEWSLWDTDTLWLCVITWSCIAWIAFVSAFTQPTWNINRQIGALIGEGDGRTEGQIESVPEIAVTASRISPKTPQFPHRHPTAEYKQMRGMLVPWCACIHMYAHTYTYTGTRARAHRLTRVIPLGQTSRRYLHFPWNIPNRARCSRDFTLRAGERIARTYVPTATITLLCTRPFQSVIKEAKCKGSPTASRLCHYSRACTRDIARLRRYRCTFIIHEKDTDDLRNERNDDGRLTFFFS